jgi:hypothetical protein
VTVRLRKIPELFASERVKTHCPHGIASRSVTRYPATRQIVSRMFVPGR